MTMITVMTPPTAHKKRSIHKNTKIFSQEAFSNPHPKNLIKNRIANIVKNKCIPFYDGA